MKMSYVQGVARAIGEALAADPRVLLIGAGFVGLNAGARQHLAPIIRDHADRILPTPVSELALAGAGIGAALAGQRPLVDLSTGSFIFQAYAQVVNEAANIHYMTGGQSRAPVTFHSLAGIRGTGAAQHSHAIQGMLANVPGLQLLLPGSAGDAYHLLRWALLESEHPSLFISHSLLLDEVAEFDPAAAMLPVGKARVARAGRDVTIVASSVMVPRALAAADRLQQEHGIAAEVVDLRTLAPLDGETVLQSVARTGRAVIADECFRHFGAAAEVAALLAEEGFASLRAPVRRVTTPHVPIPFSPVLEAELVVTAEKIVAVARQAVKG